MKIICLMGPTASGKTQAAIELVQKYPFEIISVDAFMIYKGMDIGTAKPDANTLKIAPHHLIDIRDPAESYSAGQFCADAATLVQAIISKGKIPLLVGGSMMYFHALQKGLSELPEADASIRNEINDEAKKKGWPLLHKKLEGIDPKTAKRIHPNDAQRISRALEINQLTGQTWDDLMNQRKPYISFPFVNIGFFPENRENLHQRITKRFDAMLKNGWIEEVESLFRREDLYENIPSLRAVGYQQIWRYIQEESTFEEMREKGIIATRQLAKRQMTWLRNWDDIQLIQPHQLNEMLKKMGLIC